MINNRKDYEAYKKITSEQTHYIIRYDENIFMTTNYNEYIEKKKSLDEQNYIQNVIRNV